MLLRNNAGRNISQMLLLVKEENKKDLAEEIVVSLQENKDKFS